MIEVASLLFFIFLVKSLSLNSDGILLKLNGRRFRVTEYKGFMGLLLLDLILVLAYKTSLFILFILIRVEQKIRNNYLKYLNIYNKFQN